MAVCIAVTSLSLVPLASQVSGATDSAAGSLTSPRQARESTASPRVAPENCSSARRGLRFYQQRYSYWRSRAQRGSAVLVTHSGSCVRVRRLAELWRGKARTARRSFLSWQHYQYAWWDWMPDKWQRIGACETGYGKRPGNFRHSNSSYEGFAGFAKSSWDSFKYRADPKAGPYPEDAWQATPRQQYEVALAIWRAYGFSGWGCRNA